MKLKYRRHGRYKRNGLWNLRRAKGTVRKLPDCKAREMLAQGCIGTIDRFTIMDDAYFRNRVPTWMDKRQFRRWRRKQKKAARTRSQSRTSPCR